MKSASAMQPCLNLALNSRLARTFQPKPKPRHPGIRTGEDLQDEIAFACKMGPKSWTHHGWNLRHRSYMSGQTRLRPLQKPASENGVDGKEQGRVDESMSVPNAARGSTGAVDEQSMPDAFAKIHRIPSRSRCQVVLRPLQFYKYAFARIHRIPPDPVRIPLPGVASATTIL